MPNPDDYTIGWICAVHVECVAALALLEEEHDQLDEVAPHDNNDYTLGRFGKHHIVVTVLPHWQPGFVNAAAVARDMVRSFPNVRIGLMVGIGGGAPMRHNIRLGDVVVSSVGYRKGVIFQYDCGKSIQAQRFATTGYMDPPPIIEDRINSILENTPKLREVRRRPDTKTDRLYKSSFVHNGSDEKSYIEVCGNDESNLDNYIRGQLSEEKDVLCFKLEAVRLVNHFPCLDFRGIYDHTDAYEIEL
ncbi:hypothetical protein BJ170DRAFT_709874 [Xylariales sp. AK1849]|nr:hypothetical protein BJ170DRAFT_709874 [Xylariales sp. AK1849]